MSRLQSPKTAPEAARPPETTDRCQFSFTDGRQCRMPRAPHHDFLCAHHASKESAKSDLISFPELEPFCADLSTATNINRAMSRVFLLLAQGRMNERQALCFASLARLLLRTIPEIQDEWIATIGRTPYLEMLKRKISDPPPAPMPPAAKAQLPDPSLAANTALPTRLGEPSIQNAAPPPPIQRSSPSGTSSAGAPSPLSPVAIQSEPGASAKTISSAFPDRPPASSSTEPPSSTTPQRNSPPVPPLSFPPRIPAPRSSEPEQTSEVYDKPSTAPNTPRLLWIESLQRFVAETSL